MITTPTFKEYKKNRNFKTLGYDKKNTITGN